MSSTSPFAQPLMICFHCSTSTGRPTTWFRNSPKTFAKGSKLTQWFSWVNNNNNTRMKGMVRMHSEKDHHAFGAHEGCIASCIRSLSQLLKLVVLSLASQSFFGTVWRTHSGAFPFQSLLISLSSPAALDFQKLVWLMKMMRTEK